MKTEITFEDGRVQFNVHVTDLLKLLTGDQLDDLIEDLSCEDRIIKNVSDQIIHGVTERGWSGSETYSGTPSTPLDKAKREIAEASDDVAKREIAKLEGIIEHLEESKKEAWDKYLELQRSLHESRPY